MAEGQTTEDGAIGKSDMKILFITQSDVRWASTRLRAIWPARYIKGAEVNQIDNIENWFDYDVCIFIKIFPLVDYEAIKLYRVPQVWWDLCDPAWWWNPQEALQIVDRVDGVVVSNPILADDFEDWSGKKAHCIPDRIEPEHFPLQKSHLHIGDHVDPIRLIWFGAGQNRVALFAAVANLERLVANGHNITLTIFDDWTDQEWKFSNSFPVNYVRWKLEHENQVIASHDIALLPPYPGAWGEVKSNNKSLTAWACGLPVSNGMDYHQLEELVSSRAARADHAQWGYRLVTEQYHVRKSADEWMELLNENTNPASSD